jgi:pimeloyl-ACP methyl ester carboxylesterase
MERFSMALELITVKTADGIELDGGLYRPVEPARHTAHVLMVHGLSWNFYRGPSRWLPPLLAAEGYPCLSLNMRDHDQTEAKDFEAARYDLQAGIEYLAGGGEEVIVLAHGYACNKVICYPGWSGDQRVRRRILTTLGAVQAYRPDIWATVLRQAPALQGETLVVQGAVDPLIQARQRADELAAAASQSRVEVVLLDGADHYFNDRHEALATRIVTWLASSAGAADRSPR